MNSVRVLRDDDPVASLLLAEGWRVRHRSWGARLPAERVDPARLETFVEAARRRGYDVTELLPEQDPEVVALERATRPDYLGGVATRPAERTAESLAAGRVEGDRWFGAFTSARLVAATVIRAEGDHAETDTTSVMAEHRGRGLASAVKAAAVLALLPEGVSAFGTGGAAENAASLAMNARLVYVVTERWLTLERPRP